MNTPLPTSYRQMRSLITKTAGLKLYLEELPLPVLQANDVLVRIDAAPLNPSDIGLLFGTADLDTARTGGSTLHPTILADIRIERMTSMLRRLDQALPVGNEGAGTVVATGESAAARALAGKSVAAVAGAMYAEYRAIPADQCLLLPHDTTPEEGAAAFVNPMTALGMIDTMRREGHTALIHTAAASNLGQMLNRLCLTDQVMLVNVVRSDEQVSLLRSAGALHVCNSTSPDFNEQLTAAIVSTGATIAFDATGGGALADTLLGAMEVAASRNMQTYSRYGSSVHKQVYLYGGLDARPTQLNRNYGMAWSVGGWLVTSFMQKAGVDTLKILKSRIAGELKTTFSSRYSKRLTLNEVLSLDNIAAFRTMSTGQKYLITPNAAWASS
jgi:NADPH2:quinone reductase